MVCTECLRGLRTMQAFTVLRASIVRTACRQGLHDVRTFTQSVHYKPFIESVQIPGGHGVNGIPAKARTAG